MYSWESTQPCAACIFDSRINSYPEPLFSLRKTIPSERNIVNDLAFMSSPEQATSSTSSTSNIRLIADAFENYAKITGNDLSKNPFAAALEQSDSPEAILELLQEREKAFKEYREGSRRLINGLSPVVNVLQAFSGILDKAVGLVSQPHIQSGDSFKPVFVRSLSHLQRLSSLGSISSSPYVP